MKVVFVGTGTGIPSLDRSSPCILIKLKNLNLTLDLGPGSLRQLLEVGITYNDVDKLCFTHLHTDHIADLAPFLFASKNPLNIRKKDLEIIGPVGLKLHYRKLLNLYGEVIICDNFRVFIREVSNEKISFNSFKLETKKLPHFKNSIGISVKEKKKKFVYSGDTDFSSSLIELAKDADVLACESSFPDETKVKGHLTPQLAARVAKEAEVKKLYLLHLYPICDKRKDLLKKARTEFKSRIFIAKDKQEIII
jgi:ribonuclease BN (tRNA processing enzyme)